MQPTSYNSRPQLEKFTNLSGVHIIANFVVEDGRKTRDSNSFKNFINEEISRFGLTKVGDVYHDFYNAGFTAVVCLTESHLSVHTWPESHYVTFDIFLSNYMKDNTAVTKELYQRVKTFFNASVVFEQTVQR